MNEAGGVDERVNANINVGVLHDRDADRIVWPMTSVCVRNACTAGYEAVRQDGRHPDEEFLSALDPGFGSFVRDKVERPIAQLGDRVGSLSAEAAEWTGLPEGIAVRAGDDVLRRLKHRRREAVAA